jgi:hypothetical protein
VLSFNAQPVRASYGLTFTFREDGWFNMTKAAKHFGKVIGNFWVAKDTQAYIDAIQETTGNSLKSSEYLERSMGRNGGTWAHPKLAVFFARWLDVRFAVCTPLARLV